MKKVLFINQEIIPYVAESQLSQLGRDLPIAMQERGHEIRTFMPKWGTINERRNQLHEVIRLSGMNLIIDDTDHPLIIKVASIPGTRIQVYFIDNNDYFARRRGGAPGKDDKGEEYTDNGERAIFFARGVLETVKKLRWFPDIIHCQGWMSSVIPFYLKTAYSDEPCYRDVKIVTSIFTNEMELNFGDKFKDFVNFAEAKKEHLDKYSTNFESLDLVQLAIDYSDGIVEAADAVRQEIIDYTLDKDIPLLRFADIDSNDIGTSYEAFYEKI